MSRILAVILFLCAALVAMPLIAQDQEQRSDEEQKSLFLRFVQDRLSTPERQIRISNIDGILSERASIREITISDDEGVWLRIVNASIDWNQGALFGGRLEIRSLAAERIDYIRNAVPSDRLDVPAPEARSFEIPDFPVAIILEELAVPRVVFGENVFGLGSEISVNGGFVLDSGSLDANLDIVRLDGPGGTLDIDIAYAGGTDTIDLGVTLVEPEDGIIANLLNIEGRPEVQLTIVGSGPVADLRTELVLNAGGQTALSGAATVAQSDAGFIIDANLRGPIARLVAEPYRAFFGAETALSANALLRSGGGLSISGIRLSGGQLVLSGRAETTADNFLSLLELNAVIADPSGGTVTLPVAGNATRVRSAELGIDYGTSGNEDWAAVLDLNGFETDGLAAETLNLQANGVAANLEDPQTRRITFNGDGALGGITADSAEVQAALGDSIGFGIAGLWNAGEAVQLAQFMLAGDALALSASGAIDQWVFDGDVAIETSSIAPFSGVAGRDLSGALDLRATGTINPITAGFDLVLEGSGTDLGIDDEIADRLLDGTVTLSGRIARTDTGLIADGFRLGNAQIQLAADGSFATGVADFGFSLDLADLALVSPEASGAVAVTGTARGTEGIIALELDAQVPAGRLTGRPLRDARFGFSGTLNDGAVTGALDGSAFLDGFAVALAGDVSASGEARRISDLRFTAGGATLTGDVTQRQDGLLEGRLALEAANISTAAALLLTEASGAVNAAITLSVVEGQQLAEASGTARSLVVNDIRVGAADFEAVIADLFGVPMIDGAVNGSSIRIAGVDIATLRATASRRGEETAFDAQAALANGAAINAAGSLAPLGEGYRIALNSAALTQGQLSARLARPTVFAVDGDLVRLDAVELDVGGGRIMATGTAGTSLDVSVEIQSVPLSIANAVQPGLGLAGTINGSARITGSGGDPRASFSLTGSGINATAIGEFGIAPLQFSAQGSFANQTISLTSLSASGAGGLQLAGSGTVPLSGGGLSVAVTGSAPLALANRFVADRGGQFSGTLNLDARVTGSLESPQFSGQLATAGAGYVDPALSLRLVNITGSAQLTGESITINQLSAALATGGTVSASGSIGLTGNNAANVALQLNSARYADGNLLVATVSGNLALTGPLAQNPVLSGNVFVEEANITVPESFGGGATLIEVDHRAIPGRVAATLARARADERSRRAEGGRPSILQLDVTINAPNQVFIRGRGLDAEVGGSVRLTGPVTDIQPVGGLELIRGRLSILGQRITFESGSVTLVGDLDPFIDLVARTDGDGITVFVTVSGRASEPDISFSSNPALPEDEVLSRLIFNRSMGELSPLQLARLAGAAAELAGGGGSSLVDSLRDATGLADLDIVTDDSGNIAVQAGQYIQDNIYLGVQAGADGQTRVTVDLDITDDVRARASTGADGNSSIGVFYERDY
ncbi:translocation/assembly module TamB [Arsenicitalea aurantiaca]|uniref:Translocation/assembly module TamB n=1 Tax=Arsenicitalea aurantiaca TaxID=1783274 RepID=A0A433XJZ3_9HYPH|nr:translocation/assembly module TamB domain-containing protein [Arsenicitalea aurantiaca]RUT34412.1 translocation/assembly module TamB [Arsenicitalea aurantiaca]